MVSPTQEINVHHIRLPAVGAQAEGILPKIFGNQIAALLCADAEETNIQGHRIHFAEAAVAAGHLGGQAPSRGLAH